MYLKSIRLDGFKSFAEKTNIVLENNITAIVGPNGSGKSNIVDAIRWVLGEQSIKNLRGSSSMSDIIFNGSLSRNSSSNATVALTFDNSDHYLNTDFSELEIKRVLYKNGECDYYINNSKVRLKDITDLFLDSGAGNDSFNIISQGEVEVIIDSKPIERRAIFEEAAGVLKYKKRKNESLKKLEQTKDNILKVDLVIDELSKTIEPLKEQSMIAKRYLGFKEELKNIEIALMVLDITSLNETYQKLKKEIDELNNQLLDSDTTSKDQVSKLETLKLKSLKLDEEITKTNTNLLDITNQYMSLENERQMYTERKKFMGDAQIVDNNILKLKEELLELDKNIKILDNEIITSRKEVNSWEEKFNKIREEEATLKIKRNTLNNKIYLAEREIMELENKLEILENNISSDLKMPEAVKSILNNPKITGIHNTIGKLMTIDNNYLTAMDTILGNAVNYLVVDDEEVAKDCINYLKDNKLGRATFFPLNIIKARYVEPDIKTRIEKINGFIGIASDLVSYQEKYENIIKNQLGNVIVVENIEAMNLIGRILEHKYRVVTLEGEIMYAGGSITGGTLKNNYGTLKDKKDLEIVKNTLAEKKETFETNKTTLNNLNTEIELVQKNSEDYNRHLIMAQELLREKLDSLNNKSQKRRSLNKELEGSMALKNNDIDEKLMEL